MKARLLPTESGRQAEKIASAKLQRAGLRLLTQNYRCRYGETDLIMQDGDTLVFVEVRQRNSGTYGSALESIDTYKMQKLVRCAKHYLAVHHGSNPPPCRFDVVAITRQEIDWIKDVNADIGELV